MQRSGIANLPLHYGKAPRWLFNKMVELSEKIVELIVLEQGSGELLRKLSDPYWFQAFGCVLGFDWHSSGLTTTALGALKVALSKRNGELGLFIAGGKGKQAMKTPEEIDYISDRFSLNGDFLKYVSRIVAKVDNVALQDGYKLYHHTIIFTKNNDWCVIQQGLNDSNGYARRYHWLKEKLSSFVIEPHTAICSNKRESSVLDLTAKSSKKTQSAAVDFLNSETHVIERELNTISKLKLPRRHFILPEDLSSKRIKRAILTASERKPENFEQLLSVRGVGEKTLRALALVSELVYSAPASIEDPARFSFAHGGKDGHPFPVDKVVYNNTIETLKEIIGKVKVGESDKNRMFKRLSKLTLI